LNLGAVSRVWRRLVSRPPIGAPGVSRTLEVELAQAETSFEAWFRTLDGDAASYVELSAGAVAGLARSSPREAARTVEAAARLLGHEFDLLGSGPFVPVDPDRSTRPGGYRPIDWYWDPVSRLRFPRGIPVDEWDLYTMRPGLADIKLPWELGRCQHWIVLGQAFRLSSDPRFAREVADQLRDFVEANPVGIGVQWTCTMDVALRAASWVMGLALIRSCAALDAAFWQEAYSALFAHGAFIESHLENGYEVTSNHYLSDVVGLFFVARLFNRLPQGKRWERLCRHSLEEEMQRQVLEDGADFESSITYHRLVTELFLGAARLADHGGAPLSAAYRERLARMIDFHLAVARPDGLMPQVGDADDGRLHVFTDYGRWRPQDGRHLLAPAALMFGEHAWLNHAGEAGRWEAGWWGYDVEGLSVAPLPPPDECRLFPQAGLAVLRERGHYLLVTNGRVGTKGIGNHKHNDQLGFEYHAAGRPVLVDPGSLAYTGDPPTRNRFRSTASHNTVRVDGEEQNELNPEWLFRVTERANPEHTRFERTGTHVEYQGRHRGYRRLSGPVTHERTFRVLRDSGSLLILDRFTGDGEHELTWHFHGAPGAAFRRESPRLFRLDADGAAFYLSVPEGLTGEPVPAAYSPSYGVSVPCQALDLTGRLRVREALFFFTLGTEDWFARTGGPEGLAALEASMRGSRRAFMEPAS
jgi:hypothetical protein